MLDESIIGGVFFEFIGVFTKWIFYSIGSLLKGEKPKSFLEIWNGGKKGKKKKSFEEDFINEGIPNIVLGIIVTILLCWLLIAIT